MKQSLPLPRYSVGVGDRFAHQAEAQLRACNLAADAGVDVTPVWNKSNREHIIVGSDPAQTRAAADAAVQALGWQKPYFLDADHVNLTTYQRYLAPCDFFTIDVADAIGQPSPPEEVAAFVHRHPELLGALTVPDIAEPLTLGRAFVEQTANKFLAAVGRAGEVYRAIAAGKGTSGFVAEISMDETDSPQTPPELLLILAAIADEDVPVQTIAPKFTGRFNKGVDYVGDFAQFRREFRDDLATIAFAAKHYDLPANLKLSVHSGSDKFSLYPVIHEAITERNAGVHLKTAGTSWLEELIGLAESGGEALTLAQEIYGEALAHIDELCGPYATVIDIRRANLPTAAEVRGWMGEQFVRALRHDQADPHYNPDLRQMLHVGFKIAAKMGPRYTEALEANRDNIGRNVTENLWQRHIRPVFLGQP